MKKTIAKTTSNRKQIKVASTSRGSVVVENREIFQELLIEIKKDVKITGLKIQKDKLFAQLSDGRELSIPINWFAKWGVKGVSANKLKKYEVWEGDEIYFPDIDEVLGIEKFNNLCRLERLLVITFTLNRENL